MRLTAAGLTAAAVVQLGGVGYLLASDSPRPGITATVATPAPAPPPATVLVTIGDSFTASDWTGPDGWPVQVARGSGAQLVNVAHGGAGYVNANDSTFTYQAAALLPADASVVVVWGGYNDRAQVLPIVAWQARATYAAVRRLAPDAQLVVIGPQWPDANPSPVILAMRDVVHQAAAEYGATWVDPIAERWLAGHPELIGPDGIHPNSGPAQSYLAQRIGPTVVAALAR